MNQLTIQMASDQWKTMRDQAEMLVKSGFLPPTINTPEKAIAIMLQGAEIHVGPMASFAGIQPIQGKPTISPQLMLAIINRSGLLEDMTIEDDGNTCTVMMKRVGRKPHTTTFSMADAAAMGLAGKDNWKKQPKVMRQWRTVAANCRVTFPDVISGMYTPEEMGAEVNDEGEIVEGTVLKQAAEREADFKGYPKAEEKAPVLIEEQPTWNVVQLEVSTGTESVTYPRLYEIERLSYKDAPDPETGEIVTYVSIAGAWFPSLKQIKPKAANGLEKLFADENGKINDYEVKGSVQKHFGFAATGKGPKTIYELNYEEAAALYRWKKEGEADPRWYADKIKAEVDTDKIAQLADEHYFADTWKEGNRTKFIENLRALDDPLQLKEMFKRGWDITTNEEDFLSLSGLLASKVLVWGDEAFEDTVKSVHVK